MTTASVSKLDTSTANVVDGFSERFNTLMDRAGVPRENRITVGARRFDVVPNTFINWCEKDKIPGKHVLLVQIVEALLKDVPGRYDPQSVVAWLLTGEAVPNPFQDDSDAMNVVELYFEIADLARRAGVNFDGMSRDVRNLILRRVKAWLQQQPQHNATPMTLDDSARSMVLGMIEAAQMRPEN